MNKRLTLLLLTALLALPASAHAASYTATYTAPDADWSYNESDSDYNPSTFGVASGLGHYNDWSLAGWRLTTPDNTVSISSVRIAATRDTTNSAFHARIRTGTGSQGTVQFDTAKDGFFANTYTGTFGWVQAELSTPSGTDTSSVNTNTLKISSANITYTDNTAPTLTLGVPSGGWYAATCVPFSYAASDSGSQIWTVALVDQYSTASLGNFQSSRHTQAQPGTESVANSSCVAPSSDGAHRVTVAATDYAGNQTVRDFTVNFDLTAPSINTDIYDHEAFTSYQPTLKYEINDQLSGIGNATATIDGQSAPSAIANGELTVTPDSELELGRHTVTITATDNVGNQRSLTRQITVGDTAPPTITVNGPTATGDNTPVLDVQAADDKSGIDPGSWTITIDGQEFVAQPVNNRVLTDIGYLVNQHHTITVAVRDRAGNTTTKTIDYTASSFPGSTMLPGINGIYPLTKTIRARVGQIIRIHAAGARNGRPLAGLRAEIRQKGRTIAAKTLGSDGTVDMQAKLYYRKPVTIYIEGSGLPAQVVPLRWR